MPTTLSQIARFLEEEEVSFTLRSSPRERSSISLGFGSENYRDEEGDLFIPIRILLHNGGQRVYIYVPNCYSCPEGPRGRQALMETLLASAWCYSFCTWELDPGDGEIRASTSVCVTETDLAKSELLAQMYALLAVVDLVDPWARRAISDGTAATLADFRPDDATPG